MADTNTAKTLEELRRQVAALSATRRAKSATSPSGSASTEASPGSEGAPAAADAASGLSDQIEDLADLLSDEFRESPVLRGVAIFAAGVLVGRLLR